jgi:hypothetical protein
MKTFWIGAERTNFSTPQGQPQATKWVEIQVGRRLAEVYWLGLARGSNNQLIHFERNFLKEYLAGRDLFSVFINRH